MKIQYHADICVCDAKKKDLFQWQELVEKLAQCLSRKGGRKKRAGYQLLQSNILSRKQKLFTDIKFY